MPLDHLTEAEKLVWRRFRTGDWADLRTGDPALDDVTGGASWGPERTVDAEVIRALLLGAAGAEPGRHPALRLRGARVTGRLDLMGASVEYALVCEGCHFEEPLRFVEASTKTVRITGSRLPALNGARLRLDGILNLHLSRVEHGVRLDRAKITGEVTLRGATLGPDSAGVALAADGMAVDGNVECDEGFTTDGAVRLRGARLTGSMSLIRARLSCPGGRALDGSNLTVDGWLAVRAATVTGRFGLQNARIAGWIDLAAARLSNPGGDAFTAGGLAVDGGVWAHRGFAAEGAVRLVGARLGGNLTLTGAHLDNPGGTALNVARASMADLDADELTARGVVIMAGAEIARRVTLKDARLDDGPDDTALNADGLTTGTLVMLGVRARGAVVIRTARISGRMTLADARLSAPDIALRLSRTEIGADLFCHRMTIEGRVKLTGARIGRELILDRVRFTPPGDVALDARTITVGELTLTGPVEGAVQLDHARVGVLRDDPDHWPSALQLDGFTYDALEPRLSAAERLTWLSRDPGGCPPQPYEQLAAFYTRIGQPGQARRVLYARELHQRRTLSRVGRVWSFLQDATVGYGYRSWRAVAWLALLLVVGSVVYGTAHPPPLKAGEAPHFNPVVYTLDLLLPIVDLGQQNAFNPAGAEQWFSYVLVAAGWVLATTIAAGVARVITRR
ncbi:translocation/assembly module TamB domain-containing protein [Actinoallomurus soli]|uniref:hypothetical protein n=1 Tax=Actinoallomurus soli TaxID=2952535 RepID=UPI002092E93B|nr:hypothetical protein [Actinoallomurus soli]MCO5967533.1 hypothetical protein [Actinoallomurus soli]